MISNDDIDYIKDTLVAFVSVQNSPRLALINPVLDTTIPQEVLEGTTDQIVGQAVRAALRDKWNHTPSWLDRLLTNVKVQDSKVVAILAQYLPPPPPPAGAVDPLDASIMQITEAPFIGRRELRTRVRFLESQQARLKPILVINGINDQKKVGKTYSVTYIKHFAFLKETINTYKIEYNPEAQQVTPDDLASDLVGQMGRSPGTIPPPDTNLERHIDQLVLWVLSEAMQTKERHWFILDNFNDRALLDPARKFVVKLSSQITNGKYANYCRIILISFDQFILAVDDGQFAEEIIQPCKPSEIETAVGEILTFAPAPVDLARILPMVTSGLPAGEDKLYVLNLRLRSLIFAVRQISEILPPAHLNEFTENLFNAFQGLPDDRVERRHLLELRLNLLRDAVAEIQNP